MIPIVPRPQAFGHPAKEDAETIASFVVLYLSWMTPKFVTGKVGDHKQFSVLNVS